MLDQVWTTKGFEAFRQGEFGNAGHNLYVSRAGVLQRIHLHDFNQDGYFDLVFCNSQNHLESVPAYVYTDVLGKTPDRRIELPSDGALSGVVADLNGDGFDDLVLGCHMNGVSEVGLNSLVYFGSPEGWSERHQHRLPTPQCTCVAAGDFNGDHRMELAFLCDGRVRIFPQSSLGFEPKRYVDLDITAVQITAHDLDRDGYADLICRSRDGSVTIYWGGTDGLVPNRALVLAGPVEHVEQKDDAPLPEVLEEAVPLVQVVEIPRPHVFVARCEHVELIPVGADRRPGVPIELACPQAMAVSTGDIKGGGSVDLVVACRQTCDEGERSWIYWASERGFDESRRTPLNSRCACDVVVTDLDGDGCADIILCQDKTDKSYTSESLVYRGGPDGISRDPVRLLSHDARRAFVARPDASGLPQVVLVNHFARTCIDNVKSTIYFGGPDGYRPQRRLDVDGSGAVECIGCDINDDGRPDLVLCNASEYSRAESDRGSFIYLQDPGGFPAKPSIVLPTTHAHGCCCADLNRDGFLDLIFGGIAESELQIFYGGPNGFEPDHPTRLRMEHDGVVYNEPRWIYLADLNNDGWLDLVVPQISFDRSFILWGGPDGFSMDRCQMLSAHHVACVRAVDFTGNGYLDLILGGHRETSGQPDDSFIYIYWNGPDGLRDDRRMMLPAKATNAMAVADFNNDGRLDLFVASYASERERDLDSCIYWNREDRTFSARDRTRLFTHSASGCVPADFNANGWIDLAVANHKVWGDHVGYSEVWWNGPDGFDRKRTTRLATSGPHGMRSIEPGSIRDRGQEEYYVSEPFLLPEATRARSIRWKAETPAKTWVKAQIRWEAHARSLGNAAWMGPGGPGGWFENGQEIPAAVESGGWIQYRLALGSENSLSTPRVTEVGVYYG